MPTYLVPLNEKEGEDGSVTADRVHLTGTKKKRLKQFRAYLRVRTGELDYHKQNDIIKALGFDELLKT